VTGQSEFRLHQGKELIAMIFLIISGLGALVALAVVVGVIDRASSVKRRLTAAQRREQWELRHHGVGTPKAGASGR
jgi:hypothetical protein